MVYIGGQIARRLIPHDQFDNMFFTYILQKEHI